ncbi:hypothetical protein FVE85_9394 [Porphyridium purpureum]|uniref:Uncharacterized protein n=1 Tax=Porphyridium purpureum TaxID=35688 RepID=A0A5J4YGR5_PORPP|nr:hypothetical protein FVE85_9394 [Porphyridium purpureum]|eukprot:POR0772..scf255_21
MERLLQSSRAAALFSTESATAAQRGRRNGKDHLSPCRIATHAVHGTVPRATQALNSEPSLALDRDWKRSSPDSVRTYRQLAHILKTTDAPFDTATLFTSLKMVRRMQNVSSRTRLAVAVRILQRARMYKVPLSWSILTHFVTLAEQCNKVTVVLVINRLIDGHQRQKRQQALSSPAAHSPYNASLAPYNHSPSDVIGDADALLIVLHFLLRRGKADAAAEAWKRMRTSALSSSASAALDAKILSRASWICVLTIDTDEAEWISSKYKELGITPEALSLDLLTSTFIHAGQFDKARSHMRWLCDLGYVLHEKQLHHYIDACMAAKGQRPLGVILIPLSDVLVDTVRLGSNEQARLRALRTFMKSLSLGVSQGWLADHVQDAATCAWQVYERWAVEDSILASHVVYIASRSKHLDIALRVAHRNHTQARHHRPTSAKVRGALHAFAYEALVESCVRDGRWPAALAIVFGTNRDDSDAFHMNAFAVACYIRILGQLGRLDLCSEAFDVYSHRHGTHVAVSTAYMSVLGAAAHATEAIAQFRALQQAQSVGASAPNEVTFSVLGSILLKGVKTSSHVVGQGALLSVDEVAEMAEYMEDYLRAAKTGGPGQDVVSSMLRSPDAPFLRHERDMMSTRDAEKYEQMKQAHTLQELPECVGWKHVYLPCSAPSGDIASTPSLSQKQRRQVVKPVNALEKNLWLPFWASKEPVTFRACTLDASLKPPLQFHRLGNVGRHRAQQRHSCAAAAVHAVTPSRRHGNTSSAHEKPAMRAMRQLEPAPPRSAPRLCSRRAHK